MENDYTINIDKSVTYRNVELKIDELSPYTLYGNTMVKSLNIYSECKRGDSFAEKCTALDSVKIWNTSVIGNYAFSDCENLEYVSLGNVSKVGARSFFNCCRLAKIVTTSLTPPTCGNEAFSGVDKWSCEVYVPKKSIEAYKNADGWKEFLFIYGIDDSGVVDIDEDGISINVAKGCINSNASYVEVYNVSGTILYKGEGGTIDLSSGVYIVITDGVAHKISVP